MTEKDEYVKIKNYERKRKSSFMIYADFESILVPDNNEKQNPKEFYRNKYQKHIVFSYGYKLGCVDDKFSKPFKTYLGKDAVYSFINIMIQESKCCSDVMNKHFNKELVMTKEDNKNFKNSTKCWICDFDFIDNDVKVRGRCHITGKYRESAHRNRDINVELYHKIHVVFHNLKNNDSHFIMQEQGKFNLKINIITNGSEKYMSFIISNKLSFTDSFQFLGSSLDSLAKYLGKDNFTYLS